MIVSVSRERPPRYKEWGEEQLQRAYQDVKEGRLSIRRAAELYSVPKSTLSDRVSGRVQFGSDSGPARYLTDEDEEELANFLCGLRKGLQEQRKMYWQ